MELAEDFSVAAGDVVFADLGLEFEFFKEIGEGAGEPDGDHKRNQERAENKA